MTKKRKYYHISSPENVQSILETGIKANEEGQIFLLDTRKPEVISYVAQWQCGFNDFALFSIEKEGLLESLISDNVAERTANHQVILTQRIISPKYIKLINCYKVA